MTTFTITITDPDQLAALTWARTAWNAMPMNSVSTPVRPDADGKERAPLPNPNLVATDSDWVLRIVTQKLNEHANAKDEHDVREEIAKRRNRRNP